MLCDRNFVSLFEAHVHMDVDCVIAGDCFFLGLIGLSPGQL